eukprot:6786234-Pyramimonas_sp.AAC.1
MAQLDLSWLVWSITGSDREARLGGLGLDPVQVLAFRYASLSQDPDIEAETLDSEEPTQAEAIAAEMKYDVLRQAALYADMGVGGPSEGLFPPHYSVCPGGGATLPQALRKMAQLTPAQSTRPGCANT